MSKYVTKHSLKAGLPPGSLVHIGKRKKDKIKITELTYSQDSFVEKEIDITDTCLFNKKEITSINWINVDGIHEVDILEKIGRCFGLHPLVLEDILNTEQRPKIENLGEYIYIVVKLLSYDNQLAEFATEQVSFILGENFVISFNEKENDLFTPVREQIRQGLGRIRKLGADYLIYTLLDIIVDNYFVVLEELGEKIEDVEDEVSNKTFSGYIAGYS